METLKSPAIKWALVVLAALIGSAVAFGASSKKPTTAKLVTAKLSPPVVPVRNPREVRRPFAVPSDPQVLAEERATYAPSDAFRKQAETDYQSGDLVGAEAACFQAFSAAPTIHGQKQQPPFIGLLLGRIYLKGGQYAKAVSWLQRMKPHTVTSGLDLDLALAYVRLGDYKNASRFYSDGATLQYHFAGKDVLPQDLPGTDTPGMLEASILLARGLDAYYEARRDDALVDFQAANRLAPNNALIAYHCATILSEKGQVTKAAALYARAATGRALIAREAERHLEGVKAWMAIHKGAPQ